MIVTGLDVERRSLNTADILLSGEFEEATGGESQIEGGLCGSSES